VKPQALDPDSLEVTDGAEVEGEFLDETAFLGIVGVRRKHPNENHSPHAVASTFS
jgi:hypothetical protein